MNKKTLGSLGALTLALGATTAAAAVTQLPANSLLQSYQSPTASVTASGSMNYNTGTASGGGSESDSNATGERLGVSWQRKGYGYDAFASAQNGLVKSYSSAIDAGNQGSSSASSSATWTDYFVITGNDAVDTSCYYWYSCNTVYTQATAMLSANIDGKLAGNLSNGSASFSFSVTYSPVNGCSYWYNCGTSDNTQSLVSESRTVSGRRTATVNDSFESEFTFRYNTPFRITATLNTTATEGGLADFSHTGSFDLVLPEGAQLVSASGLQYSQVSGVPEPESWLMLAAGLGMLGFVARRRKV